MTLAWGCIHEDEDIDLNTHRQELDIFSWKECAPWPRECGGDGEGEQMNNRNTALLATVPTVTTVTSYTSSGAPAHCQDTPATSTVRSWSWSEELSYIFCLNQQNLCHWCVDNRVMRRGDNGGGGGAKSPASPDIIWPFSFVMTSASINQYYSSHGTSIQPGIPLGLPVLKLRLLQLIIWKVDYIQYIVGELWLSYWRKHLNKSHYGDLATSYES